MATLRDWIHRLWGTLRRNPRDRELEEELKLHLELAQEDMRRRGGSPDDGLMIWPRRTPRDCARLRAVLVSLRWRYSHWRWGSGPTLLFSQS